MLTKITDDLATYLANLLGINMTVTTWAGVERLPHLLKSSFRFVTGEILNQKCLFAIDMSAQEQSPAVIGKRLNMIQDKFSGEIVYVRDRLTTYNRKRLIGHKIPFIVPGNQMYLPMLGVDLREHLRKLRSKTDYLSPSTQALLIHILLNEPEEATLTPSEIAPKLEFTVMTASRAYDELEAVGIGEISLQGRKRCLKIPNRREIWNKALPHFKSPVVVVHDVIVISKAILGPASGYSALAHYSNLAEPQQRTYAASADEWRDLNKKEGVVVLSYPEPESVKIEVWRYHPGLFAKDDVVDPLSLYLSLRNETDERVESALDEMMDEIKWLKA